MTEPGGVGTPGTEAGRVMYEAIVKFPKDASAKGIAAAILAIEAEARASLLAAVREGEPTVIKCLDRIVTEYGDRALSNFTHGEIAEWVIAALLDTLSDEQETGPDEFERKLRRAVEEPR